MDKLLNCIWVLPIELLDLNGFSNVFPYMKSMLGSNNVKCKRYACIYGRRRIFCSTGGGGGEYKAMEDDFPKTVDIDGVNDSLQWGMDVSLRFFVSSAEK